MQRISFCSQVKSMRASQTFLHETNSQPRIVSWIEAFWRDLRVTLRSFRQKPGFTLVVVLSLALGIGANTAIFSLVDAILLRPLPVPHPHDLVVVDIAASRLTQFGDASYLDYRDFRSRSQSFQSLAISKTLSAAMNTGQGDSQMVWGLLVSGSFFSTMQVPPVLGRDFRPEVSGRHHQLCTLEPDIRERSGRDREASEAEWPKLHHHRRLSPIIQRRRSFLPP